MCSGFLAPKVNSSTAFTISICDPKSKIHQHRQSNQQHPTASICPTEISIHTMMLHSACLLLFFFARETLGFNVLTLTRKTGSCLYDSLQRVEADNAAIKVNTRRNVLESFLTASVLSTTIFSPSIVTAADGVDYKAVAEDVAALVVKTPDWGPTLVRLAWHSSGTYDKMLNNGGSSGGTIRFKEELAHGGNAGLADTAVSWMDPIYAKYKDQGLSYADLYTLGGGKQTIF
jgi:Peroxidase